ncbi:MAG: 4-(cytidine 5'-diphospho)-2-C-methyl-D-erythritol kinase [Candidatus Brocadiia bacterium]
MDAPGCPVTVRCPAKLNLFLEVLGRRPDGYHDIDTVMQAIDLYDELHIAPRAGPALRLECDCAGLPSDERNLALRAAMALKEETGYPGGARLRLTKRIPVGAGLGGGSSDAAGALVGLDRAWGLGLRDEGLRQLAARVGSDVAFFLRGGTARCTGRGEAVEPAAARLRARYALVCPPLSVSTAEVYKKLRFPLTPTGARASMLVQCLAQGDVEGLGATLYNRLEEPAFHLYPGLREGKSRLEATGLFAGVLMTGSGAALFGLRRPRSPDRLPRSLASLGLGTWYAVRGIGHGVGVCSR